jgi:hypothetical protein
LRADRWTGGGFLAAALALLQAESRPLTDREITALALERVLLRMSGKTPRATMSACLYFAIQVRPEVGLVRPDEPGPSRARCGSVCWTQAEAGEAPRA